MHRIQNGMWSLGFQLVDDGMEPRTMDVLILSAPHLPGGEHQLLKPIADILGVGTDAFQ